MNYPHHHDHEAWLRRSDGESDLEGISLEKLSAEPPALMKKPCRKKAGQKGHKKKEGTKARKPVICN